MLALITSMSSLGIDSISERASALEADIRVYARGAMALALIPWTAPSVARFRVSPKTAPLAAP